MSAHHSAIHRSYVPSTSDIALLEALLRYHCMTIPQVTKLLYAPSSRNWVQSKLSTLHHAGFLDRDRLPIRRAVGPPPLYYVLTRQGMQLLAREGIAIPDRARPYRIHGWDYYHLRHLLAVNELLIAAQHLVRAFPQVTVARWLHDLDFKRAPYVVTDQDGRRRKVEPDGYLEFLVRTDGGYRLPVCLELDRGTEKQEDLRRKVRTLLRFAAGPFQEAFGRQTVTFCFIASKGPEHLARLKAWTEAELTALGAEAAADLFQLATFALDWDVPDDQRPTPADLFTAPRWSMPFQPAPGPLLDELA